jgi:hypothetical protein
MRIVLITAGVLFSHLLVWGQVGSVTWQELLDRADSLVAAGEPGRASAALDSAMSHGTARFRKSDSKDHSLAGRHSGESLLQELRRG